MDELLHKELAFAIIGAGMEVHNVLGPGFPEQVYQLAFEQELFLRNIPFAQQQQILVAYKGITIAEYFLDLVIDKCIVVELKALSQLAPVHEAQLITYLKASGLELGLLMNFGETSLKFKRVAASKFKNSRNSRN